MAFVVGWLKKIEELQMQITKTTNKYVKNREGKLFDKFRYVYLGDDTTNYEHRFLSY